MATPGFQLYQDKENVSSIGAHPKARSRHGVAPVAKIFGGNSVKNDFRTPARKALGSVNREPSVATPTFIPSLKGIMGMKFRKPSVNGPTPPINKQPSVTRPIEVSHQNSQLMKNPKVTTPCIDLCKPKLKQQLVMKEHVKNKVKLEDEEIETMFITKKEEDDFEDIWPKKDRPSSYLNALINWRPSCFGDGEEEETSDEEERRNWCLEDIKAVNDMLQNLETDVGDFEVPPLELLPESEDIPIPDIAEHIGSLVLKED